MGFITIVYFMGSSRTSKSMDPVIYHWLILRLNAEYLFYFRQFRVGCNFFDAADFAANEWDFK